MTKCGAKRQGARKLAQTLEGWYNKATKQFKIKEKNHARWNKQTKKHKKEKG